MIHDIFRTSDAIIVGTFELIKKKGLVHLNRTVLYVEFLINYLGDER